MTKKKELGLIHVYTGNGKGKTTTAVGLALRAVGSGFRVRMLQFMKAESDESGEITAIKQFENVDVTRHGGNLLVKDHPPLGVIKSDIAQGLARAREIAGRGECELLILDEINVAVSMGLADKGEVLRIAELCKGRTELILTGRGAPDELIDIADYVTEFKMVKHPYEAGIAARWGIEY